MISFPQTPRVLTYIFFISSGVLFKEVKSTSALQYLSRRDLYLLKVIVLYRLSFVIFFSVLSLNSIIYSNLTFSVSSLNKYTPLIPNTNLFVQFSI